MNRYICLREQIFERPPYALIPVQHEHIEAIRRWRNAQLSVLRQSAPISAQQQVEYFSRQIWPMMNLPEPDTVLVSLFREGDLIGYGGLVHIAWEHSRAELSFLLAPERVGDPDVYAEDFSAFLSLIKQLAFDDLRLHRLFTETFNVRPHHIALLEANDFAREGVLIDHVRIDGQAVNSIFHGCLNKSVE